MGAGVAASVAMVLPAPVATAAAAAESVIAGSASIGFDSARFATAASSEGLAPAAPSLVPAPLSAPPEYGSFARLSAFSALPGVLCACGAAATAAAAAAAATAASASSLVFAISFLALTISS